MIQLFSVNLESSENFLAIEPNIQLQGAPAARRRAGRRPPTAPRARSPQSRPAAGPAEPGPGPRPPSTRRRRPSLGAEGRYLARAHPPPEVGGRRAGRTDRRTRRRFRSGRLRELARERPGGRGCRSARGSFAFEATAPLREPARTEVACQRFQS